MAQLSNQPGTEHAAAIYMSRQREADAVLIARYGAERYAAEDLIPRGIITTEQELAAFSNPDVAAQHDNVDYRLCAGCASDFGKVLASKPTVATVAISDGRRIDVRDGNGEALLVMVQPDGSETMICSMNGALIFGQREAERIAHGIEFDLAHMAKSAKAEDSTLYASETARVLVREMRSEPISEAHVFHGATSETVGVVQFMVESFENGEWNTEADLEAPMFDVKLRTEAATLALQYADEAEARIARNVLEAISEPVPDILDRLGAESANQHTPEGVSVFVVTKSEDLAREAGPMLAKVLYPDQHFAEVLHVEPLDLEVSGFEVVVRAISTPLSAVKVGR